MNWCKPALPRVTRSFPLEQVAFDLHNSLGRIHWSILVSSEERQDFNHVRGLATDSIDVRNILGPDHLMQTVGMDCKHTGNNPDVFKYLLVSSDANVRKAWKIVGQHVAKWLVRREYGSLHVFCQRGRHRSMAWAFAIAIILKLLGLTVSVWNSERSRLCRRRYCLCNRLTTWTTCHFSTESNSCILTVDGLRILAVSALRDGILQWMRSVTKAHIDPWFESDDDEPILDPAYVEPCQIDSFQLTLAQSLEILILHCL